MIHKYKCPVFGETIHEGEVSEIIFTNGSFVGKDSEVLSIQTDKVDFPIPSEYSGKIHFNVKKGDTVKTGQILFTVDDSFQGNVPAEPKENDTQKVIPDLERDKQFSKALKEWEDGYPFNQGTSIVDLQNPTFPVRLGKGGIIYHFLDYRFKKATS